MKSQHPVGSLFSRLRNRAPYFSEEATERAAALVEEGKFDELALLAAAQMEDQAEEATVKKKTRTRRSRPRKLLPRLVADSKVTEAALISSLQPDVESFRRSVFGRPQPPFRGRKAAADWIEKSRWQGLPFPGVGKDMRASKGLMRYVDLHKAFHQALRDLEEFTGTSARITFDPPQLAYYAPHAREPTEVQLRLGCRAEYLAEFVEDAARRSGFLRPDLTDYVLTGKVPRLKRLDRAEKERGPLSEVVITIRAQSPCWEDLAAVYKEMQEERGRASLFDEQDLQILQAVQGLGGPPEANECSREFWEDVWQRLPRPGRSRYRDWRGPMMRWRRLPQKNPRLGEIEPCNISFAD